MLRPTRSGQSLFALLTLVACYTVWLIVPSAPKYLGVPSPATLEARAKAALHTLVPPVPHFTVNSGSQPGATVPIAVAGTRDSYMQLARQDAAAAGIPPEAFVRQINQESGFDPRCNDPSYTPCISSTGAEGLAQFEPGTASGLGVDPFNPEDALWGAAQLMSRYNRIYGDYRKALAAYNGGSGTLEAAMNACGANWLSCEPAQTRHYIQLIDP